MTDVQDTILDHLRRGSRGKVYTSKDLVHLGNRPAVDQTLSRLARDGTLQRLARGLYYYPRTNPRLGIVVSPNADEIAAALARQTGSRIAPSGAGGKPARAFHPSAGQTCLPYGWTVP